MSNRPLMLSAITLGLITIGTGIYEFSDLIGIPRQSPEVRIQNVQAGSGSRPATHAPLDSFNTTDLTLPRSQILSGGPAKDGIPSLTDPKVVAAANATFLRGDDRIVTVTIDRQSRAYPILLLNWHEAINDQLAGTPLAIIYCPLCDSVSVVDRRITPDKTLEFGISGLLTNSNVLLYDRTDQALWSQVGLTAISGPHVGKSLKHLPWQITTFSAWKTQYPTGTVVGLETGYQRNYERNPYAGYFATDRLMFPVSRQDPRLPPKSRVIGIRHGDQVRAYPIDRVARSPAGRVEERIGDGKIVLETDAQTGTVRVTTVPSDTQVVHTFWFAWAAFHSDTTLYSSEVTP